jgi:hypothetical protein
LSISSWNIHPGQGNHQLYSKLISSTYFNLFGLPFSLDIPILLTSQFLDDTLSAQRLSLGDLAFYAGKRFGTFEPRVGLIVPLFYSTKGAWIGSNNTKLRLGLGYRAEEGYHGSSRLSAEMMYSLSMNSQDALLSFPSSDVYVSVKGVHPVNDKTDAGVEILLTGKYAVWNYWKNSYNFQHVQEIGTGVYPAIFGDYRLSSTWYLSGKIGAGSGFKISNDRKPFNRETGDWTWATNFSVSINRYF